ncbi:MAG: nucleotidyltransferase domain-containing protein [Deltaproteobacteria bacterium]|nr:nucleotidyltransferase domain-containing protein [Deltaproteobacteria bacterium]
MIIKEKISVMISVDRRLSSYKIEVFCKTNHIELLILFGSRAKKRLHAGSDFDLAIKLCQGQAVDKLGLIYKLGELLNTDDIDLVILTPDTDPVLLWEIFMEGRLIYERMAGLFEKEKLRAWKIYLDTERFRKYRREYVKGFVRKVKDVARSLK